MFSKTIPLIFCLVLCSCQWSQSLLESGDAGGQAEVQPQARADSKQQAKVLPTRETELELRLAKLWSRVDELEAQQVKQRERMKLIEKGLMLGIVPEGLKELPDSKQKPQVPSGKDIEAEMEPQSLSAKKIPAELAPDMEHGKVETQDTSKNLSTDANSYRQQLAQAQAKFNAAQFGQAIVAYNQIGENFSNKLTEGNHYYWIGLSWYQLKEYALAEQNLQNLVKNFPDSSWLGHSRLYLAKIDLERGLTQRARTGFREISEQFSNQEIGEMARLELEKMRDKL